MIEQFNERVSKKDRDLQLRKIAASCIAKSDMKELKDFIANQCKEAYLAGYQGYDSVSLNGIHQEKFPTPEIKANFYIQNKGYDTT